MRKLTFYFALSYLEVSISHNLENKDNSTASPSLILFRVGTQLPTHFSIPLVGHTPCTLIDCFRKTHKSKLNLIYA